MPHLLEEYDEESTPSVGVQSTTQRPTSKQHTYLHGKASSNTKTRENETIHYTTAQHKRQYTCKDETLKTINHSSMYYNTTIQHSAAKNIYTITQ